VLEWSRRGDLLGAVERAGAELVHVQHGAYLGRDRRLLQLFASLARRDVGRVITLHGVHRGWLAARFHRALAAVSDRIVVHQPEAAAERLLRHGVPREKIAVIPHGTPDAPLPDRTEARRRLGLSPTAPIALFLGFLSISKSIHTVVRAFPRVIGELPQARLVVAGRPEKSFPNRLYLWFLERLMRRGRAAGWLDYRPGYLPSERLADYLAAADLLLFPYQQSWGSASGILHRAFGAGRAILCARGPKFAEAQALGAEVPEAFARPGDPADWARCLTRLLADEPARRRLERLSAEHGRRSLWPDVAARHLALYQSTSSNRAAAATRAGPSMSASPSSSAIKLRA
jgi:glycosyltransferase involved in cell wall biosynthesis